MLSPKQKRQDEGTGSRKDEKGAKNYPQMTQIGKKAEGNTKRQKPNEKCQNGERLRPDQGRWGQAFDSSIRSRAGSITLLGGPDNISALAGENRRIEGLTDFASKVRNYSVSFTPGFSPVSGAAKS